MKNRSGAGALNILLLPFILMTVFFLGAAGFTYWAYNQKLQNKAQSDTIANNAIQASRAQISAQREKEFAIAEAFPFSRYESPATIGSITIQYPKSWSAYVKESVSGSTPIDGYFYPGFVPNIQDRAVNFAGRLQVVDQSQDSVLLQFNSYREAGMSKVQTYRSPNIPNVIGYRIDGKIDSTKNGIMIILPLRDKTVKLWTESSQFSPDYLNTLLPNFSFRS